MFPKLPRELVKLVDGSLQCGDFHAFRVGSGQGICAFNKSFR